MEIEEDSGTCTVCANIGTPQSCFSPSTHARWHPILHAYEINANMWCGAGARVMGTGSKPLSPSFQPHLICGKSMLFPSEIWSIYRQSNGAGKKVIVV